MKGKQVELSLRLGLLCPLPVEQEAAYLKGKLDSRRPWALQVEQSSTTTETTSFEARAQDPASAAQRATTHLPQAALCAVRFTAAK